MHLPYVGYDATQRLLIKPETFIGSTLRVSGVIVTDWGFSETTNFDSEVDFWSVYCGERHEDAILTMALGDFRTKTEASDFRARVQALTGPSFVDAMALWEAVCDLGLQRTGVGAQISKIRELRGTCELRDMVASLLPACLEQYFAADFDESFDWEWCPMFLRDRVDWSGNFPIVKTVMEDA